ncbi:MAG: CHAP domain-containing protein [Ruminococcaceae bacterium]|nr:CHAP domain-containing protein [Oscillospiraceae bacterium]
MASVTATQVLDLARTQIGVKATDIKRCKYNKWYYGADVSGVGYDWCEVFIQWLFYKLDASSMLYTKTANCGAQGQAFYKEGKLVTKNFKVGDIVMFHWTNAKSSWVSSVYTMDHVGIIEKVNSDGTYTTIEGNTGNTTNGEVMRRTRYLSQISCACRPAYKSEISVKFSTYNIKMSKIWKGSSKNKSDQVLTLQCLLYAKGYKGKDGKALALDGDFGVNTEYALKSFEKAKGLDKSGVSGVCERAKWALLLGEYKK